MGLDTTHGCWHGPYSQFMRWRSWLHVLIQADRGTPDPMGIDGYERSCIHGPWPMPRYVDQRDPLNLLMSHSDCDGEIPAEVCGPMADALEGLMERRMPARGIYDMYRPTTERFIAGLRRAAEAGEAVVFK